MHKYISKLVVCVHRHNQKHIHARRHMWATQRHNSSIVSFYMHKVLQHSPNTHLPNLKHSSNTLHYSVLYQSINNLSPTHKHQKELYGQLRMCSKIAWVKGWPPREYTNIYKGLCALSHTHTHTHTHRRSVSVFKSYSIMLISMRL